MVWKKRRVLGSALKEERERELELTWRRAPRMEAKSRLERELEEHQPACELGSSLCRKAARAVKAHYSKKQEPVSAQARQQQLEQREK
jgi:hypothetical protein